MGLTSEMRKYMNDLQMNGVQLFLILLITLFLKYTHIKRVKVLENIIYSKNLVVHAIVDIDFDNFLAMNSIQICLTQSAQTTTGLTHHYIDDHTIHEMKNVVSTRRILDTIRIHAWYTSDYHHHHPEGYSLPLLTSKKNCGEITVFLRKTRFTPGSTEEYGPKP
ncbi:hypothetical protein BDC45DRAFT_539300 [Circinella umbellata]|nr:hypothetical protein BDC45DRAFT_539300 [Circinella umbellata]